MTGRSRPAVCAATPAKASHSRLSPDNAPMRNSPRGPRPRVPLALDVSAAMGNRVDRTDGNWQANYVTFNGEKLGGERCAAGHSSTTATLESSLPMAVSIGEERTSESDG